MPAREASPVGAGDIVVAEGDAVAIGEHRGAVLGLLGQTVGHVAYHLPAGAMIFVGDTSFAMGCGRLFEGGAAQRWANMRVLAALSPETQVFCAHEYTHANARFAMIAEPDNPAIVEPLISTTSAAERRANAFLRARSVTEFAERTARHGFK